MGGYFLGENFWGEIFLGGNFLGENFLGENFLVYNFLTENVWVWGSGASRSGGGEDVTIAGQTNKQTSKVRATQPLDH